MHLIFDNYNLKLNATNGITMKNISAIKIITCISSLFTLNLFSESAIKPSKNSNEIPVMMQAETKTFAPNSLFYPPARSMNPMAALEKEAFLQHSFHWTYFHNPLGKTSAKNSYGEQLLLD